MKKLLTVIVVFAGLGLGFSQAQSTGDWMFGAGLDVFKTDNEELFDKTQLGLEANYFLVRNFALTAGLDIWSQGPTYIVLGTRFYPINPVFIKFRGLIGDEAELALGMGYAKSLNRNWRAEVGGDYFFNQGELAIRVGIAYVLR